MMEKINKDLWYNYIKTYESFNKKIPDELKKIFNKIRLIVGEQNDSFNIDIDLRKLNFCELIVKLEVNFEKLNSGISYDDKDIVYYSNINIHDLITNKDTTTLPVTIKDVNLDINKLNSVISHEIRHIYNVYNINEESDIKSFTNSLYYNELKNNENNKEFLHFFNLVYLSLEHELIARNTMIWEMFKYCKVSKNELYNLYHQSFMYKSFEELKSFNYNNTINIPNILEKVNNFINYFGGELCKNNDDVILFFENWNVYFIDKSVEYLKEGYEVLEDILLINEFKYNQKTIKNVKDILLHIHNNYIFKK